MRRFGLHIWITLLSVGLTAAGCGSDPGCGTDAGCVDVQPPDDDVDTDEDREVVLLTPGSGAVEDPTGAADYVVDFGSVEARTAMEVGFSLVNEGTAPASLTVSSVPAPFSVSNVPAALAANESGVLTLGFAPTESGPQEAIVIVSGSTANVSIRLRGKGVMPALDCPLVAYGTMLLGEEAGLEIRCVNNTDLAYDFEAEIQGRNTRLVGGPSRLEPGAEGVFLIGSTAQGNWRETLRIVYKDELLAEVQIQLDVKSGPSVTCSNLTWPFPFDEVVLGMAAETIRVSCSNGGDVEAEVLSVTSSGAPFHSTAFDGTLAPGESAQIDVTFEPTVAGEFSGQLVVELAPPGREVVFPLSGSAIELPACQLVVLPSATVLDFFEIEPETVARRELILRSGEDPCVVREMVIEGDERWLADSTERLILEPRSEQPYPIIFTGGPPGTYSGTLRFRVSDPAAEEREVALEVTVAESCVHFEPEHVKIGLNWVGCETPPAPVSVRNACSGPVVFEGVGAQNAEGPGYQVVTQPEGPVTLAPGESVQLELTYARYPATRARPPEAGAVLGGFTVTLDGRTRWLGAETWLSAGKTTSDSFMQMPPATDTFPLVLPVALSGDPINWPGGMQVEVDHEQWRPNTIGTRWRYSESSNSVVFEDVPQEGSPIRVEYRVCALGEDPGGD